jgi:uncharacterized damage-inducible protein DinB
MSSYAGFVSLGSARKEKIMKMTDLFLAELEREAVVTRRALERVPEGKYDWKPHPKSMPLGQLARLVAFMPSWITMMVNQDELDLDPAGGSKYEQPELRTRRELVEAHDKNVASAREALSKTTDEHLMKDWRMLVAGRVVDENVRHIMLRDGVYNHLAHHRGQLTVYLRLNDASVPEIYGPSADEGKF